MTASCGADAGFYAVRAYRIDHHGLPLSRLAVFLDPGVGVDARAPASADPLLPRRQDLAALALDALGATPRSSPCWSATSRSRISAPSPTTGQDRLLRRAQAARRAAAHAAGFAVVVLLFFAISLSWVIRQVVLYRRSSGDRRQQLKWLLAGGSFAVFGFFIAITIGSGNHGAFSVIGKVGFLGLIALPISIGIGILRYRLYDIDRLISRTLSYTLLTGLLVGVFAGLVLLTTRVLPFSSPGRRRGLDPRRRGALQPAARRAAAARRPPLQPRPLRRRGDRRRVRRPPA